MSLQRSQQGGTTAVVLASIGAFVLVVGASLLIYFTIFATSGVRGRVALHNNLRTPTQQQFNYEYFHDTCHDVLAKTAQIATLTANLKGLQAQAPANDPLGQYAQQEAQARTDIAGLANSRDTEAQAYNAKSNEWTRNYMRSKDLPPSIDAPYFGLVCEGAQQ